MKKFIILAIATLSLFLTSCTDTTLSKLSAYSGSVPII
jgi:hypothetical protein